MENKVVLTMVKRCLIHKIITHVNIKNNLLVRRELSLSVSHDNQIT